MAFPAQVRIVEVGPRDGLQNEPTLVTIEQRLELIRLLGEAGLRHIEAGSFVSPRWVPQMAGSGELYEKLPKGQGISYPMLVPNPKGLELALQTGVEEIAIFAAASESFSQKNINCSIAESLARYDEVMQGALEAGLRVRGYVSCVLGCPYEGAIDPQRVAEVAERLFDMGCYEISLGDTIGTGTPLKAQAMIEQVAQRVPVAQLAAHFHDTYGQALANLYAVLELGVSVIDSSVSGLGGCPYAKGASGNVATEDVLYLLNGMGIETAVDLNKVIEAGRYINAILGRDGASRVARAMA